LGKFNGRFDGWLRGAGVSQAGPAKIIVRRLLLALAAVALALLFVPEVASAQGWWPFGGGNDDREEDRDRDRPPVPQEPVYRQPSDEAPAPMPQGNFPQGPPQQQSSPGAPGVPASPSAPGVPGAPPQPGTATNWSTKNPICYQLEQRLVQEGQKSGQSQNELPRIEDEIRVVDRAYNDGQSQLDRGCYEYFLFTKTFRNSPQCKDLARQVDVSKRRLADLEARRQDIVGSSGRSYQDDIIRELARNNCGANYADMARRHSGGMWEDEESTGGNTWSPALTNGAQTYRTLCVRLCDGFYFPVSFSTLPSHFPQDADVCTSKCAAPTELYYYPNPGGSVDQSVALKTQEAYTKLKFAFRYRKEYVNGCSCKTAEYVPADGTAAKKAEAGSGASPKRADAGGAATDITTGSTAQRAAAPPVATEGGWQTEAQPQAASDAPARSEAQPQ
jgi:hypothetical protein